MVIYFAHSVNLWCNFSSSSRALVAPGEVDSFVLNRQPTVFKFMVCLFNEFNNSPFIQTITDTLTELSSHKEEENWEENSTERIALSFTRFFHARNIWLICSASFRSGATCRWYTCLLLSQTRLGLASQFWVGQDREIVGECVNFAIQFVQQIPHLNNFPFPFVLLQSHLFLRKN